MKSTRSSRAARRQSPTRLLREHKRRCRRRRTRERKQVLVRAKEQYCEVPM